MLVNTKKPSGLSITRKNFTFVCSWKIGDSNYGVGQEFKYRYYHGTSASKAALTGWININISSTQTTRNVSFSNSNYYPNNSQLFYWIEFQVRGKRSTEYKGATIYQYKWSEWTTYRYVINPPRVPSLTAALDSNLSNVCKFTWDCVVNDEGDAYPFVNCEWQSILVKNSDVTDGSKLSWKTTTLGWLTGTGSRNSSTTITEDSSLFSVADYSYTRWVRVRSRGPCGPSTSWRYAKHVYAIPQLPSFKERQMIGSLLWVKAVWAIGQPASHPIDEVSIDYAIDVPKAGLAIPDSPSWHTVNTQRDTGSNDAIVFLIQDYNRLPLDNLIWLRINVKHDRIIRSTTAVVYKDKVVYTTGLTAPSDLSIQNVNTETHRIDVEVKNNSSVPDSKVAIIFAETGQEDLVLGWTNPGQTSITIQCPDWGTNSYTIKAFAFQGSATSKTVRGVTAYTISANMKSSTISSGGDVPMPPTDISLAKSDRDGEVVVTWSWSWSAGTNGMEISWSQNPNAWESTDQPSTFIVSDINAPRWRIADLDSTDTWYFRLRQTRENGDTVSYGPYSDPVSIDLFSDTEEYESPILQLSNSVIHAEQEFKATWTYDSPNNLPQEYAEIRELTYEDDEPVYSEWFCHTEVEQHLIITAPDSWVTGSVHLLCARVRCENSEMTEWSNPVSIAIADPVTCEISDTSLEEVTIETSDDPRTVLSLTEMPLVITVNGASESGTTMVNIERVEDYHIDRPDESVFHGYAGETVYSYSQNGSSEITIDSGSLIGYLDDGAVYKLVATVIDPLGQIATDEIQFEVHWSHQALMPEATVEILEEYGVAKLTPIAPTGTEQTDVCDIYRLSVDKPELVYANAEFGTAYIDPYPVIGEFGGYRFVFKTANNDYITEDNVIAWLDETTSYNTLDNIIDFGGDRVNLRYNVDLSNAWSKDFNETHYLGGSVQGDWNPSVSRTASVSGVAILATDHETIESIRRLAVYSGVCHIRTRDGSSFDANIDVTESRGYEPTDLFTNFVLSVTRVDSDAPAGIPYDQWSETI